MKFGSLTVCLDMHGCPNRCRHCWIGAVPNGNMPASELADAAEAFASFADSLEIYDWYREPDFANDYKEMWELCKSLSDPEKPHEHYELASVWRLVRDEEYVKWLSSLGLGTVQLTLFGNEEVTDFYTGRKGAYREILQAADILLANRISPRIQIFVNQNNIEQLPFLETLIKEQDWEARCRAFGGEFACFVHQGSCDGENAKFYDVRVTPEDLKKIPETLVRHTLRYFGAKALSDCFGKTEQLLYEELVSDQSTKSYVSEAPVFYVDKNFDVYPNVSTPAPFWRLGNLKKDGAEAIVEAYTHSKSFAQRTRLTTPICEIVKACGNPHSRRLFTRGDYVTFMLNRYCADRHT